MTLLEEIQNGENVALEFKEARPKDSLKFTKTVVAFANGKGGRLIFGIEDGTRNIVGIPKDKVFSEMDAIVNVISETCTPSISPDVKIANVQGKSLIIVDVKSCPKTPYYIKKLGMRGGTFVRIGATTRGVEEYRLKGLIIEGENLSFDKQPVRGATVSQKDVAVTCRMMTETARKNSLDDEERKAVKPMTVKWLESKELLLKRNGKLIPTYAYYIVAGRVPQGMLEPRIRCGAFFDDRLEITSPGGLVKDFTIEQAESGISKIRNMGLAAALEYMKDVEGWGGGVSRYFEKCAELGLPPPNVEELDGGFFRVTFYRDVRVDGITQECKEDNREGKSEGKSKGMSKGKSKGISKGRNTVKSSDRIISLLAEDPTLRQNEIAERVGLSLAGVEKIMRHLRTEGKLIREGSSRNGRWKVV